MRSRTPSPLALLCILFLGLTPVLCAPTLGIQRDYGGEINFGSEDGPHSYSGVIEFDDPSIPGDASKMSDGQFRNLAKVAYYEMLNIWKDALLDVADAPGAMVALESEGRIYFASSIRGGNRQVLATLGEDIPDSVGHYQAQCVQSFGYHRVGGSCAEPNVLRLYGDVFPPQGDPPNYRAPRTTETNPRLAAWILTERRGQGSDPLTLSSGYALPCGDNNIGWGCKWFVDKYGLKPVPEGDADGNGEDNWKFRTAANPRQSCSNSRRLF